MPEFVPVATTDDIGEGDLVAVELEGRQIAMCCVDGVFYAFDDTCTHRGCSLSQGELDGTEVVCPCHAGTFDVTTGEVVEGPPPDPLETFRVRVRGEDVEIQMVDR
jgi:3-phenylpropionate/trans-cinnamate dioxygenase ferredoxin subunit